MCTSFSCQRPSGACIGSKSSSRQFARRINHSQEGMVICGRTATSRPARFGLLLERCPLCRTQSVRAGLVTRAEDYAWSSASAHCGSRVDLLVAHRPRSVLFNRIDNWSTGSNQGFRKNASTTSEPRTTELALRFAELRSRTRSVGRRSFETAATWKTVKASREGKGERHLLGKRGTVTFDNDVPSKGERHLFFTS
jgi:hypothetical protein